MQRREEKDGGRFGNNIRTRGTRHAAQHVIRCVSRRRGWCITAFGRTPACLNIPRIVQNRTGFEVAKKEEAEKMTGERGGRDGEERGGGGGRAREDGSSRRDGVAAAVKERSWIRDGKGWAGWGRGDKGRQ